MYPKQKYWYSLIVMEKKGQNLRLVMLNYKLSEITNILGLLLITMINLAKLKNYEKGSREMFYYVKLDLHFYLLMSFFNI